MFRPARASEPRAARSSAYLLLASRNGCSHLGHRIRLPLRWSKSIPPPRVAAVAIRRKRSDIATTRMPPAMPISTEIVLLGAGHAHVEVLRRLARRPEPKVRFTLIGREPHTPYSGMLPGLIRGDYDYDAAHIDVAPLASASGARLILEEAIRIDLGARAVIMRDRPPISFDLLSINVGGEPQIPLGASIPVKPIGRFLTQLDKVQAELPRGGRIAVVGAGAGGVELALALSCRFGERFRIVLVSATPELLPEAPPRARSAVRGALAEAGVELVCGAAAQSLSNRRLALADGSFVEADAALWATPVVGPRFLATSGLTCDEIGCVRVDRTLRSISHPFVFAAGDCASVEGAARPKAGLWAVRAGPPLAANLRRAARGTPLRGWHSQRQGLVILGLGHGQAVAWRNGITLSGPLIWRWKDHIDRRWMGMFRMRMQGSSDVEAMRCAGCGAKVDAQSLTGVLAALAPTAAPGVLIGLAAPDDAAVIRPPPGEAVVQSVDHFRALIDDPFIFGEIAAAHALSDLYAMGARPWTALAIASVPYAAGTKMRSDLAMMMQGAARVLEAENCTLVGGHSAEAAEAALGFAVNGLVDPHRVWRKAGLRPGDSLILTKPLGTGILLAGHMRGLTKSRWLVGAVASMRRTNAAAARILREVGVSACTDVSGFGLAGHLSEMLLASGVAAMVNLDALPVLPGALELAREGVESSLAPTNRRFLPFRRGQAEPCALLVDPQTSGGLLAGLRPERVERVLTALAEAGITAAVVGYVRESSPDLPSIVVN